MVRMPGRTPCGTSTHTWSGFARTSGGVCKLFAADGSHEHDVTRRSVLAMKRYGQLRNIFSSPDVPLKLKLSIYKAAVMSILIYGCLYLFILVP